MSRKPPLAQQPSLFAPVADMALEHALFAQGYRRVAGVDEAGRGCLAGPVVAAAVVLAPGQVIAGVADSKQLSAARRARLYDRIRAEAVAVAVGTCSPAEIDRLNILWAALEAMRRAVAGLAPAPDFVLVDGDRAIPESPWPVQAVVRGDQRCHAVAAASIVAKVTRDRHMAGLAAHFPAYGWAQNAGYPTAAHYAALEAHGPTRHHRRSFRLSR